MPRAVRDALELHLTAIRVTAEPPTVFGGKPCVKSLLNRQGACVTDAVFLVIGAVVD